MKNVLNNEYRAIFIHADASVRGVGFYQDKIEAYQEDIASIVALAEKENRDLTEEEIQEVEQMQEGIEKFTKQLNARQAAAKPLASRGRKVTGGGTERTTGDGSIRIEPSIKAADQKTFGFKSFGEFAACVGQAGKGSTDALQRFQNVASTYGSESNGPDGGYLIPPEFGTDIWQKVTGEDSLYGRCTEYVTSGNNMVVPKDETTPWGTSGIQVYWEDEGAQLSASKPTFQTDSMRLNKLTALVNVTDELLADAPGLASYITARTPQAMTSAINEAIINGNGVGKPLGIMQAASLLTLSKEVSQDAGTFIFQNVSNMYARLFAALRGNAVWLINQDVEPQLDQLAFSKVGENMSGSQPLYMPVAGLQDSPNARLKSRPVLPQQSCQTVGTSGDVILVDLSQYAVLAKAGGVDAATSMHLYFDQSITAFRFIFRMTGKPMWNTTISPRYGSNTLGWAVVMEDRG